MSQVAPYVIRLMASRTRFTSSGLHITPTQDYLAGNGGVPDATRILEHDVPDDVPHTTALCRRVLRDVYGVSDAEALDFTHEEHK